MAQSWEEATKKNEWSFYNNINFNSIFEDEMVELGNLGESC